MSSDERAAGGSRPAFRVGRRGYDREQVDRYMADLRAQVTELEIERNKLSAQLLAVGIEGSGDLESEFDAVSVEVGRVLQAAREAAEGMRSRAAEDGTKWREAAESEALDSRRRAEQDAMALRGDAWRTGTELLQQVRQEAERIRAAAEQDAILTRAEAEQEAHRLMANARKEIAEEARLARSKSERGREEARVESERLVAEALLEAEAAQERVRALEQRRAELMRETEAARTALTAAEADLETSRHVIETPAEPGPEPTPLSAEPEAPLPRRPRGWAPDDGSVRIVSPVEPADEAPVDAEAMAAEVRRMRERREAAITAPRHPVIEEQDEEMQEQDEEPPLDADPEPTLVAVPGKPVDQRPEVAEVVEEPAVPEVVDEPVVAEAVEEPAVPEVVEEPVVAEARVEPAMAEPAVAVGGATPPAIDDLFARLRSGPTAARPDVAREAAEPAIEEDAALQPSAEPPFPLHAIEPRGAPDPFEVRDRLLLPLTNGALRTVKRTVVDLQNRVLEELRISGGQWEPEARSFAEALSPPIAELTAEARHAGRLAAGELTGAEAPEAAGDEQADLDSEIVPAMVSGLAEVLERASAAESGPRQQSAAVSRYFRVWRTDEAERRVWLAALGGYHAGLVAACAELSVPAIVGVADGSGCAACPASTAEQWVPGDPPPDGTTMPPALAECRCTVAPC